MRVIKNSPRYGDLLYFNRYKQGGTFYNALDMFPLTYKSVQMKPTVSKVGLSGNYLFAVSETETWIYDMSKKETIEYKKQKIYSHRQINALASINISGVEFMMLG
jgi:hypothetical protein